MTRNGRGKKENEDLYSKHSDGSPPTASGDDEEKKLLG
jgi:hypothetical protein